MRSAHVRAAAAAVLLFAGASVILAAADRRPITETDLLKFQWIADPQISPDGREIAYVLVTVNEKEDRYDTSLWSVATAGGVPSRRLTAGPRDSAPRWSPDGRTIAFLRAPGEKDRPQIHLLPMSGGEARRLTDVPKGAAAPVWSPDGRTIAFTSTANAEDLAEKKSGPKSAAELEKKERDERNKPRIITRAVYRFNNQGWLDPSRRSHVWTVPVVENASEPAEAKQLTTGRYDEGGLFWSSDGSRIYFTSTRVDEPYYDDPDSNLYSVPAGGGEIQTVADIAGPINGARPSPDGKRFAFTGFVNPAERQSHTNDELFVFADGKATTLTADYDYETGSDLAGDQRPPRGNLPNALVWTPDGRSLILTTTEKGRSNLVKVDVASRRIEALTTGDHDVMAYTATPDASKLALLIGDATHIGDIYLLDAKTKKRTQLTRVNDPLFAQLDLSAPEEIWYDSFDGKKINAWIQKPPGFQSGRKYPLIVEIHGGPHTAYGHILYHEMLWMAAKGYVVLYTNPRGSTSYGQDFANVIQYRYPGDDYKDIMAGVDEIVKRGYVDEKRMGVTGGSGGGLLTNWTVTQTDRFAAAVSQRSVADWTSFWYSADFTLFRPSWFRKNPYEDPEEFLSRSPVRYAQKIVTPILFIEGDEDWRTPSWQGGEAMFRALKAQKKTAVMVNFPGENHELSRSGKPSHRVQRLQHIVNWFDKYLQGKEIQLYDLQ
jgi:dipeptidyl aminopeptidase/acylaminoacyl peptidase